MVKVITYGTYDLLHHGHIRLLERAKALGDYLIVGVTADDFDKMRGKINVQESLMERIEKVRATGIADEIIVEEYEGQKIDDIRRYDIDIFTIGSDWEGQFDYLNDYCKVIYLERTKGISSSEIRSQSRAIQLGIVGDNSLVEKYINESEFVNGIEISSVCTSNQQIKERVRRDILITSDYNEFLERVEAVYIVSLPINHYEQIQQALLQKKHVLCEAPITIGEEKCRFLFDLAKENNVILMEAIKTAYSTAYNRLLLIAKSGGIGTIVSVDVTCTSLEELQKYGREVILKKQNSIYAWGSTALLPIFQLLGIKYEYKKITSWIVDEEKMFDLFTKIDFKYKNAIATAKVGKGVKSEGELIISGTKGYIYVPAPWWKTDYFEVRFENSDENKRYFYQLDGEGIRYELVSFLKSIESGKVLSYVEKNISESIAHIMDDYRNRIDVEMLQIKEQ